MCTWRIQCTSVHVSGNRKRIDLYQNFVFHCQLDDRRMQHRSNVHFGDLGNRGRSFLQFCKNKLAFLKVCRLPGENLMCQITNNEGADHSAHSVQNFFLIKSLKIKFCKVIISCTPCVITPLFHNMGLLKQFKTGTRLDQTLEQSPLQL